MSLEEAYAKNLVIRQSAPIFGEKAPYEWIKSPDAWPGEYMPYSQMLEEHALELANSINKLRGLIGKLSAWEQVLREAESDEMRRQIVVEFVDSLATVAINLPYVIRSRFIYSVAHLSHQANRVKLSDWKDNLALDNEVYFRDADVCGKLWKTYGKLKLKLEKISDKSYSQETLDFRNKYNHRYSPRIEYGLTGFVVRLVSQDGRVTYGLGQTEPLKISRIVELLKAQHTACICAYKKYQALIEEQICAIGSA